MEYILTIQHFFKKIIQKLYNLPHVEYKQYTFSYYSINSFNISCKNKNDTNNKIREYIIGAIVNNKIPSEYFNISNRWYYLKKSVNNYITILTSNINYDNIKVIHKGGRKYNYDMDIILYKNNIIQNIFNIELKFNANKIDKTPQFVSPMKPSKYFDNSYEEYFYDNYLPIIFEYINKPIPSKTDYIKSIHNNSPIYMLECQKKYYSGCKNSSKFTNNQDDISFYNLCKKLSKESIYNFINNNNLNYILLQEYIINTQKNKVYMLYKNGVFILEQINIEDYMIQYISKKPKLCRYECLCKNGKILKVLLRWKNGNSIAYPAFQIS